MKQLPLTLAPDVPPSFDRFVPDGNELALAHLRAIDAGSPPVYLWGPAGSGKTHLLRALFGRWQAAGRRAGWFDAGRSAPWPTGERWPLVLLDECDRYDDAQQHAAFALFVEAADAGAVVAAAGRVPPTDLPLREDLRSRLGWGPVYALQPLAEPQVRALLRREADARGIALPDEVLDYLLTRLQRDPASLLAMLDRLDGFSLASQRAVTVPLLRDLLAEAGT